MRSLLRLRRNLLSPRLEPLHQDRLDLHHENGLQSRRSRFPELERADQSRSRSESRKGQSSPDPGGIRALRRLGHLQHGTRRPASEVRSFLEVARHSPRHDRQARSLRFMERQASRFC